MNDDHYNIHPLDTIELAHERVALSLSTPRSPDRAPALILETQYVSSDGHPRAFRLIIPTFLVGRLSAAVLRGLELTKEHRRRHPRLPARRPGVPRGRTQP